MQTTPIAFAITNKSVNNIVRKNTILHKFAGFMGETVYIFTHKRYFSIIQTKLDMMYDLCSKPIMHFMTTIFFLRLSIIFANYISVTRKHKQETRVFNKWIVLVEGRKRKTFVNRKILQILVYVKYFLFEQLPVLI